MNRTVGTLVAALALLVSAAPSAQAAPPTATQVNVTLTSAWTPPSPDPSGLTYRTNTSKVLVSDADVDETALSAGVNIWEMSPAGAVATTGNTNARTTEPLDVAWDNVAKHLYIVDDVADDVFRINPQGDGLFGTTDDTSSRELNTNAAGFGSLDPEGLAYRADDRSIYLTDGASHTLFHVERGPDGLWGGGSVGDDIITTHDTAAFGMRDPEDVEYDPASGHLFLVSGNDDAIAEVTTAGVLVNTIDITFANLVHPTGITLAPGSDDASETHVYVSDRGVTEAASPEQNDGRIFEFAIESVPDNEAPVVVNPGDQTNAEGDDVSLQIEASDPQNDPLTYDATGLPADLAIDADTGLITGTIAAGAAATSPYSVTVTASDGTLDDSETFSWTVTEESEPSILFRSASTGASDRGAKTKVLELPAPAGVQAGDVLVAAIDARAARVKTPAGWTLVRAVDSASSLRQALYVRAADTEPASYQFALNTKAVVAGAIAAYEGVDPDSPVVAAGARKASRSASITAPSVTATEPNSMLVGAFGIATDTSIAPAGTMTERAEASTGAKPKSVAIELSDETLTTSGATGERVATADKAAANIGAVVVLRPAS